MPYIYTALVQYYDEFDDRFWFDFVQVPSEDPISRAAVLRSVDDLIAQKLSGPQYEQLRDYLANEEFSVSEQIVSVFFQPP